MNKNIRSELKSSISFLLFEPACKVKVLSKCDVSQPHINEFGSLDYNEEHSKNRSRCCKFILQCLNSFTIFIAFEQEKISDLNADSEELLIYGNVLNVKGILFLNSMNCKAIKKEKQPLITENANGPNFKLSSDFVIPESFLSVDD